MFFCSRNPSPDYFQTFYQIEDEIQANTENAFILNAYPMPQLYVRNEQNGITYFPLVRRDFFASKDKIHVLGIAKTADLSALQNVDSALTATVPYRFFCHFETNIPEPVIQKFTTAIPDGYGLQIFDELTGCRFERYF